MFNTKSVLLAVACAFGLATFAQAQEAAPAASPDMPAIDAGAKQEIAPATAPAQAEPAAAEPAKHHAKKHAKKKAKKHKKHHAKKDAAASTAAPAPTPGH